MTSNKSSICSSDISDPISILYPSPRYLAFGHILDARLELLVEQYAI